MKKHIQETKRLWRCPLQTLGKWSKPKNYHLSSSRRVALWKKTGDNINIMKNKESFCAAVKPVNEKIIKDNVRFTKI